MTRRRTMGKNENEVIIRWDETDEPATIYSASPQFTRKMRRLEANGTITLHKDYGDGKEWYCNKKLINVRAKRRSNMTPEQKDALRERLKKSRRR
jgi:hypothetical protein